jgi:LysM repeat protein
MKWYRAFTLTILLVVLLILVGQVFGQTTYTVKPGDTLYSISRSYGVSVQAIAAANNIVNPNLIYAGQTLTIPGGEQSPGEPPGNGTPPQPPPQPPPSDGGTYVVQRGDTLFRIAVTHGVTVAALAQANGISNPNIIYAGQVLTIPGSTTPPPSLPPSAPPPAPPPTAAPPPSVPPPAVGINLLPNPSFEQGYYNQNGIPELQVPNGWQLNYDEGQPAPGTGIGFVRPESRVLPRWLLPPHEQGVFIWHGDWTVKVFKGGAPFSVRYFTDVTLSPGTYQFTANYFPDLVAGYSGGQKVWTSQPAAGEVAFIKDGVGGWQSVSPGSRNQMVQTFTVPTEATVRVGVAFRTRYTLSNNGFFFDAWSLQRISD